VFPIGRGTKGKRKKKKERGLFSIYRTEDKRGPQLCLNFTGGF
jgi:hypothetical protein